MRRATLTAILVIATVLTAIAGFAVSQRSQHPARLFAVDAASTGPLHVTPLDDIPTTTTTRPPPLTTAPQRPVRATVSRGTPHRAPAARSGGGPCDRPSTCPQLRQCENGGSYGAGTNPHYYGAYQFADPAKRGLSPGAQDAAADQMYAERGAQPWPTCGRFLK